MQLEQSASSRTLFGTRVFAIFRFARPHAGLLAGLSTVVGAYLTGPGWIHHGVDVVRAALAISLVVAFGFIINDYHDADLDRETKPYRAIPAGYVSQRFALVLACVSAAAAIVVAATMGLLSAAIILVLVACSALYSFFLKPTLLLGIGTVAFLSASAVAYGAFAARNLSPAALMLVVLVFLNAAAQETIYNLEDREEDARFSIRTTAVRLGPEATIWLFSALALTCAAATLIPWVLHLGSRAYVWAAILCTLLPLVGIVVYVWRERTQLSFVRAHTFMKLMRLASLVPILLLR